MLFNSYEFILLFLPIVFIGFYVIGRHNHLAAAGWLTFASLFFYGWWSIKALPLLLMSITVNYFFGIKLSNFNQTRKGKVLLSIAVILNLALLGYFKYAGFFVTTLNVGLQEAGMATWIVPKIILPIGISFYTFTQIAFLVDCYQGKVQERRFLHYTLFVTYFPHLIAGPFLHHSQMMPQFSKPSTYSINYDNLVMGVVVFAVGLFKKMMIADPLSVYADGFFKMADTGTDPISIYMAWAGVLAYTFQIYFDFSGYSDMAIGLSLLFGINIPVNFNSPYRTTSIIDFWRCWHISLSTFLRDYLYVPLGGNKNGKIRRYINLFITMLLGGLWHGASWNFLLWGGLHGLYLSINHAWKKIFPNSDRWNRAYQISAWFVTFISVCFAWVLFRASTLDGAKRIYVAMLGFGHNGNDVLITTVRDFLRAEKVAQLAQLVLDGRITIKENTLEMLALVIAWLYSTAITFISANSLDGLQSLFVAIVLVLIPFNSTAITNSLNPEKGLVEKTYAAGCVAAALYFLISCLWVMNKHTAFIYFQF